MVRMPLRVLASPPASIAAMSADSCSDVFLAIVISRLRAGPCTRDVWEAVNRFSKISMQHNLAKEEFSNNIEFLDIRFFDFS
jgi:hypothetical protein